MSHDRVFGCICHDEGDEQIVAVLALNHVLASKILALQAAFLADKARGTGIVEVTFEAHNVRFFHERLSAGPGVEDFRAAVGDRLDAEPDNVADWVDLGGIAVPAGGDYVTTYEHLHIATTYIFIEAIGKHAEAPFTTAALPCELLRAIVAEGAAPEVTGNHTPAAPPEADRTAAGDDAGREIAITARSMPTATAGVTEAVAVLEITLAKLEDILMEETGFLDNKDVPAFLAMLCSHADDAGGGDPGFLEGLRAGYRARAYCYECERQPCVCEEDTADG